MTMLQIYKFLKKLLFYRTILYVSMVYCTGNLIVSITSLPPLGAGEITGPMIGLFLIALGTGGIKPCVSAFGGDQFSSDQTHLLQSFFSVFYFAINAGSLLSMLITPVLRGKITIWYKVTLTLYRFLFLCSYHLDCVVPRNLHTPNPCGPPPPQPWKVIGIPKGKGL